MADIKLFVCCHQPFDVPKHPLLVPIQVGAALADHHFEGFLHDDSGENISEKNRSYCELTAQYWAWKNVDADYYGFFHYRRYLYPDPNEKLPYRIEKLPNRDVLERLGFDQLEQLIPQYDMIAPKGENMYVPVREHYANAPHHHRKDLNLIEEILHERHPEMTDAVQAYLSGSLCYFGNIYITSKKQFHRYCEWLFPVLEEFDRRADFTAYSPQELRVAGYLAERLFGIWLTHEWKKLHVLTLPRVHFCSGMEGLKHRGINYLLPPGSRVRSIVKGQKQRNER